MATYPLSPLQAGMLFHSDYAVGSGVDIEQLLIHFDAGLDSTAFQGAWTWLLQRHSVLRTSFHWRGLEQARQTVLPEAGLPYVEEDWRRLDAAGQASRWQDWLREDRARGFVMEAAPLLRVFVARLDEDHYQCVWSFHHILLDGHSLQILLGELFACYRALREAPAQLPDLPAPTPYQRHVEWLQARDPDASRDFWHAELAGVGRPTPLPGEHAPAAARPLEQPAQLKQSLSRRLSGDLAGLAQAGAWTLHNLVQAAWAVLLGRYSGETDVIFGSTRACRHDTWPGAMDAVGLVINTLPVRVGVQPNLRVSDLLTTLRARHLALRPHEHSALQDVHGWSDIPVGMPLFNSLVFFQSYQHDERLQAVTRSVGECRFQLLERINFPLSLNAYAGEQLLLQLDYDRQYMSDVLAAQLLGHLVLLLQAIAADPRQRVADLPLLSDAEQRRILHEWNPPPEPHERAVPDLLERFAEQASATPTAPAVSSLESGASLSYGELEQRAGQLAGHLAAMGLEPGDVVAWYGERGLDTALALLAILKAGGVWLPLDPASPGQRLRFMLDDAKATWLLCNTTPPPELNGARQVRLEELDWPTLPLAPPALPLPPAGAAYIIYTSGSTGQPKGVRVGRRELSRHCRQVSHHYGLSAADRVLQFAASGFDVALEQLLPGLLSGAQVWIGGLRQIPDLLRAIEQHRLTVLDLPLAYCQRLLQALGDGHRLPPQALPRLLLVGNEPIPHGLIQLWQASQLRAARLLNAYGPTEAVISASLYEVPARLPRRAYWSSSLPLAERPAETFPMGRRLYVLDAQGRLLPPGIAGELCIAGTLAQDYVNQPDLSARAFIEDPFFPGERLYRSGDLARWLDDGCLEFLGRIDQQVKIRGFRIELGEIESRLRACAKIKDAVVDQRDGRLIAWVVSAAAIDAEDLRCQLRAVLPEYMLPVAFVPIAEVPLGANAKIDRRALPAPPLAGARRLETAQQPRGHVEQALAAIWAKLLERDDIGRDDDFFDLGGHSLLTLQTANEIERRFGVTASLAALFEYRSLAALAAHIETLSAAAAAPIPVASRAQALPLSYAQQALWFIDQLEGDANTTYLLPAAYRIDGALQAERLEAALNQVVERHAVLRSRFPAGQGLAQQQIDAHQFCPLARIDTDPESLPAHLVAELAKPFALRTGPLLRAILYRLAPDQHVLQLSLHHMVADGWSLQVLMRELNLCYCALRDRQDPDLPPLPLQYGDYAVWQRDGAQDGSPRARFDRLTAYWRQRLAGAPTVLELPAERAPLLRYRGESADLTVPADSAARLTALCHAQGATLFMGLLAVFAVVLGRYSRQDDLLIGIPAANREHPDLDALIGLFVNTLPLRVSIDAAADFTGLLHQVRGGVLEALVHQALPFEHIVQSQGVARESGRAPLVQVMFSLEGAAPLPFGDGHAVPLPLPSQVAKFELSLIMREGPDGLAGSVEYNRDLFDAPFVAGFIDHYQTLLAALSARPDAPLCEVSMLTAAEQRRLLVEWNDTAQDYPLHRCVHQMFEAQARRTPERPAVRDQTTVLSYRELDIEANRIAHHLLAHPAWRNKPLVGLCLERSPRLIAAMFGILKAGGAYVPIDPHYPPRRIAYMLEDSGVALLVSDRSDAASALPEIAQVLVDDAGVFAAYPDTPPRVTVRPDDLAYVIYTSGSTGQPKGVLLEHRGAVNLGCFQQAFFELSEDSRVLQFAALSFDAATSEVLMSLFSGACLELAPQAQLQGRLDTLLREREITHVTLPPSVLAALPAAPLPDLRTLVVAGEACPPPLLRRWAQGRRFINAYGPTEATVCASAKRCAATDGRVSIGAPIANTRLYVLDPYRQPVPQGVAGELYIAGVGVARAYLRRPELTAERFVTLTLGERRERLYQTGDLVRWRDGGELEFLGRSDAQIKLRGFRIEPGEIESLLSAQPTVREAVVTAHQQRLTAYILWQPAAAGSVTARIAALRTAARTALPDYMVPAAFVSLDAMPLSPNGKVNRAALPAPDFDTDAASHVAPRTPTEITLAEIWTDLLARERVGTADNFFALGGHSLLIMQVLARIQTAFQLELPVRAMFEAPTIAELARVIDHAGVAPAMPQLVPAQERPATLPVSFAQQRLLFLQQLHGAGAAYHIPVALRLRGDLRRDCLQQAVDVLWQRHEGLRARFALDDEGEAVQRIDAAPTLPIEFVECAPPDLQSRLDADADKPFDLEQGPLLRVNLYRLAAREHVLLVTLHHIIADGWSLGVWWRELAAAYRAALAGTPLQLPTLPVQYADYALWQRRCLAVPALRARHLRYWRQQLAGAPALLELPGDLPRPPRQSFRGRTLHFHFPAALSEALRELGRRADCGLFTVVLAGFALLLARYSRGTEVVIGTTLANRRQPATEHLIGLFVNTLPLRLDTAAAADFNGLLQHARDVMLAAHDHQDLPFEQLVDALEVPRNLGCPPLFQVMLTHYRGDPPPTFGDARTTLLEPDNVSAKFDLTLALEETDCQSDSLRGALEYNADLFGAARMTRLIGHLQEVLTTLSARPDMPLAQLAWITHAEQQQLAVWNRTAKPYAAGQCIHQLFETQVARTPAALALVAAHGDREPTQLTYATLNRRANQLAHHMIRQGIEPGACIGVCLPPGADLIITLLGVLKAGAAYVPLDPSLPPARLTHMLNNGRVGLVVSETALRPRLPATPRTLCLDAEAASIAAAPADNPTGRADPHAPVYLIYTSGSTGMPKGAGVYHHSFVNLVQWFTGAFQLGAEDRVLITSSPGFDLTQKNFFAPLIVGGTLHLSTAAPYEYPALRRHIAAWGITWLNCAPSAFYPFVEADEDFAALASLRYLFLGGEAIALPRLRAWLQAPTCHATLVNSYGPTECTDVVAAHVVNAAEIERLQEVPLGRPIANVGLHVLDAAQQPVAVDMPGELWISGACVGMGYPDDAELSAARFKRLALAGAAPLCCYRTGDLVRRREDGSLIFLGRIDHQVKVRGFRVELGEIETALRRHPGVREAVVVKPEGAEQLAAYYTADGDAPGPAELRRHLQALLPDYMVPAGFMPLAAFPLNASGKIERKQLPPLDAASWNEPDDAAGAAPPATPLESELIAIWAELLETQSIGRHHDFFSLGGHSLLAVRMISRIRTRLGLEIPVRAVFEAPTPAQLAQTIAAASASRAMPLTALPREAGRQPTDLPPSFAQQRLWLLHRIEDLGSAYNIANAVRITGPLDITALQRAVAALGQRHEILRTTFPVVSGKPVQRIHAGLPVPWRHVDLRGRPAAAQQAELERLLDTAANRAFDLEQGPLLEVTLYQLTGSAVLLIAMHHIIADDASSALWWRDLDGLYQACLRQAPPTLPALAVQYADFAVWQRQTLEDTADGHLDYWRRQLADADTAPVLPTDHPRPPQTRYRGATRQFTLEATLAARLYAQCQALHVTPFMLFQTAFALLLCRYSGRDEIVIGAPVSNRGHAEVEGLIGFFVNTLPVRNRIDGNPAFSALLAQNRRTVLDAFEHAEMPFERLVSELNIPRSLDHAPLFQVLFIWQQALQMPPRLGDLQLTPWPLAQRSAKFDLSLFLAEQGGAARAIDGALEYNSDLFESATIDRMIGHLRVLLTALAEDPGAPVRTLPLLTAAEQATLHDWQRGPRLPTVTDCLHRCFEAQVARTPQACALIDTDGVAVSYQALNQRANRLAHYLQAAGIGPDTVVGLCLERSSELVVCILAILKAGGAYLPVDAAYPVGRIQYMLENADAALMLTHREQAARLPQQGTRTLYLDELALDDAFAETNPGSAVTPENLLYVLYTSGSTGLPKAVAMPHRPLVNLVQWQLHEETRRGVGPLRTLQFSPISFDVSCQELFATLVNGGTLVLVTEETRRDPYTLLHYLGERRVERLFLPFVALQQLAEAAQKQPLAACALREIITAGEQLQTTTAIRAWCRDLRCTLHNQYGPTETHVITACTLPADTQDWPTLPPIGRPVANTEVFLLDACRQPVPEGVVGELYLGGAGVAHGYLNQPELSRERFLPNPWGPGRLYRSGDLGRYRADGCIEYLGRADHQLKIRGYRIDPGEIETLLNRCPGVREAVVVAPSDGHGHRRLAAYVVADDAASADALTTSWKPFLQARLPVYMLPASLRVLERLPLTPSGKVDRRELEQYRLPGNPPSAAPSLGNDLERRIAAIWQTLLGLDAIDSHDNFFDVGGHSLLLVQLHERLQQELDVILSVTDLFRYPSIASLAAHLDSKRADEPGKRAAGQARSQARRASLQRAGRRKRE